MIVLDELSTRSGEGLETTEHSLEIEMQRSRVKDDTAMGNACDFTVFLERFRKSSSRVAFLTCHGECAKEGWHCDINLTENKFTFFKKWILPILQS